MCGIAVIVSLTGEARLADSIAGMTRAMRHRGPDDEGYVLFDGAGGHAHGGDDTAQKAPTESTLPHISTAADRPTVLAMGHRRLSIFDTSFCGHQPMSYRDRYWIVFNGEIYNFIELKAELAALGYTFDSETDTEIIMAAWDRWGEACVERFNGMWAFALYDAADRRLFIARDRFGIKPVYWYRDASRLVIASEIKAILACDGVETAPDDAYCAFYLRTGGDDYTVKTAFRNVFRLPPAHVVSSGLEALSSGEWPVRRYWSVTPTLEKKRFDPARADTLADTFRGLLKDSVRLRLRADVPVGLALSGGLDSTTLAYFIHEVLSERGAADRFETFSSVFRSGRHSEIDESPLINRMAERFGLTSNQIEPQDDEIPEEHRRMIWALETPTPSLHMGGWHTYRCAQDRKFKVVLDGQGADELLAGYPIFASNYFFDLDFADLPGAYRRFSAVPTLPGKFPAAGIAGNLLRRIVGRRTAEKWMAAALDGLGAKNPRLHVVPLNAALGIALETDIVNLLHYGDKLAMSHGIESRHPYLDYRLVEFLATVPAAYKMHDGWSKYLSRHAMNGLLPDEIVWNRGKLGWPDPTAYWMAGVLKDREAARLADRSYLGWAGPGGADLRGASVTNGLQARLRAFNLSSWYEAFFAK